MADKKKPDGKSSMDAPIILKPYKPKTKAKKKPKKKPKK